MVSSSRIGDLLQIVQSGCINVVIDYINDTIIV